MDGYITSRQLAHIVGRPIRYQNATGTGIDAIICRVIIELI